MDESINNTVIIDLAEQFTGNSFSSIKCSENNLSKLELSLQNLLSSFNLSAKNKPPIDLYHSNKTSNIFNKVFNTAKKIIGKSWNSTVGLSDKFTSPFHNILNSLINLPTCMNLSSFNTASIFELDNSYQGISSDDQNLLNEDKINQNLPQLSNSTKTAEPVSLFPFPKYTDTDINHSLPDKQNNILINAAFSPHSLGSSYSNPDSPVPLSSGSLLNKIMSIPYSENYSPLSSSLSVNHLKKLANFLNSSKISSTMITNAPMSNHQNNFSTYSDTLFTNLIRDFFQTTQNQFKTSNLTSRTTYPFFYRANPFIPTICNSKDEAASSSQFQNVKVKYDNSPVNLISTSTPVNNNVPYVSMPSSFYLNQYAPNNPSFLSNTQKSDAETISYHNPPSHPADVFTPPAPNIFFPLSLNNLKEISASLYASPSPQTMPLPNPFSEVVREKNPPLPCSQSLIQPSIEKQYSNTKINSFIKEPQKFSVEFTSESQNSPFQSSLQTQASPFNSMLNSNNTITNSSSDIQSSLSENASKSENSLFNDNTSSNTNLSTNNLPFPFSKPQPESDDLSKASSNFKNSSDKFSCSLSDLQNKFLNIFSDIFESVKSLFYSLYSNSYKIFPSTLKPAANANPLTFAYPNSKITSTPLFLSAPDDAPETATPLSANKRRHSIKLSKHTTILPRFNNFKSEISSAEIPNVLKTDISLQKNSPQKSFSNNFSLPNCYSPLHAFSNQNISNSILENPYTKHNYISYSLFSNKNFSETNPLHYAPVCNRQSASTTNTYSNPFNKYFQTTPFSTLNLSNLSNLQNVYNYEYGYRYVDENNSPNTTFNNLIPENIAAHANGGILSKPHLGLVSEDGPEAIIPLSPKRRERGLSLWQETGHKLGIYTHAQGGIFGAQQRFSRDPLPLFSYSSDTTDTDNPSSAYNLDSNSLISIPVTIGNVSLELRFDNSAASDPDAILQVIKQHLPELTDAIAAQLADAIQKVFANLPLVS